MKQPESLAVLSGASEGPGLRMYSLFFHSDVLIYGVTNNSSGLEFNAQSTSFPCLSVAMRRVLLSLRFVSSKTPELLALSIGQLCSENLAWSSSDPTNAWGTLFGGEIEGLVRLFLMCTFGAHMYIMRGSLRLCLRKSHAVDGRELLEEKPRGRWRRALSITAVVLGRRSYQRWHSTLFPLRENSFHCLKDLAQSCVDSPTTEVASTCNCWGLLIKSVKPNHGLCKLTLDSRGSFTSRTSKGGHVYRVWIFVCTRRVSRLSAILSSFLKLKDH